MVAWGPQSAARRCSSSASQRQRAQPSGHIVVLIGTVLVSLHIVSVYEGFYPLFQISRLEEMKLMTGTLYLVTQRPCHTTNTCHSAPTFTHIPWMITKLLCGQCCTVLNHLSLAPLGTCTWTHQAGNKPGRSWQGYVCGNPVAFLRCVLITCWHMCCVSTQCNQILSVIPLQ